MGRIFIVHHIVSFIRLFTWVFASLTFLTACSYIDERFNHDDGQRFAVARSVKAELVKNSAVEAAPIRVRVLEKTIFLDGFVESQEELERAEALASDLYPDYTVLNSLIVR